MPTWSTGSSEISGVPTDCSVWLSVLDWLSNVLTLALIVGIALKLSRWEGDRLFGRDRED
jgi:hypothetical protein